MKLIVHVDGGARGNPGPAAAACVISTPAGEVLGEHSELLGEVTNNVAEYRALLLGLRHARELGASDVEVVNDSELIAKQVTGIYKVKHAAMRPLHLEALAALRGFERWCVRTVPRAQNARADALVNAALDRAPATAEPSDRAQCSGWADLRDRDHLRVGQFLEQRVRQPVQHVAGAPADDVDVRAVVDEPVGAPVDALHAGVREQRRVQPVRALEVVVAADRVLVPHHHVGVVEVALLVLERVRAHLLLFGLAGLQRRDTAPGTARSTAA